MNIAANGISIYYEVSGAGAPLLLLHGNGEDHTIFDRAVKALSAAYTVYTPDTRAHGKSQTADIPDYETLAADTIQFIEALGLEKPYLYGFSDGGIIGLFIAILRPELLGGLIVSGVNTEPDGLKPGVRFLIRTAERFRPSQLNRLMLHEPHIALERLEGISIPVTLLVGSCDMIREKHTHLIAEHIKDSTLITLHGETHGSYIVHNGKLAPLLTDILHQYGA